MSGPPSLSVVITNFNGESYLPGLMAALAASDLQPLEVIVSDDASRDGSLLWLRHHAPEVRVVRAERNEGPSAARNRGIEAARGTWVLLLDNDAHPLPDTLSELWKACRGAPAPRAFSPRALLPGDPPLVHFDGAWTHPSGLMLLESSYVPLSEAPTEPRPLSSMTATAICLRREDALAADGFEASYFFYFEDHDFATRLRISGVELWTCPRAKVRHLGGTQTLSFRVGMNYPEKRRYLHPRGRWLFALRVLQSSTLLRLAPVLLLNEAAQVGLVLTRGWIEPWFAAISWHIGHLARTLRQRTRVQALRRVPDSAIIRGGEVPLHPGLVGKGGLAARLARGLSAVMDSWWRHARPGLEKAGQRWLRRNARGVPPGPGSASRRS